MTTYKDELMEIEAQERQLNAQKQALAKRKAELQSQIERETKETKVQVAELARVWFNNYCLERNIDYSFTGNYDYLTTKDDLEIRSQMWLRAYFEDDNRIALKEVADEFDYVTKAIVALKSVLQLSNTKETLSLSSTHLRFEPKDYLYLYNLYKDFDINFYFNYNNGHIIVKIVKDCYSLADDIIKLSNGIQLETYNEGYDSVDLDITKTVIVDCNELDTLAIKVENALRQINAIEIEEL